MRKGLILGLLLALVVLHEDWWWRYDHRTVVLGFLPVSLAWHMGISILASVCWGLVCRHAWPRDVDLPDDASGFLGPGGH
jgi:hypothetical protein